MASYEFGRQITDLVTMDDLRDEIIGLERKLDYFSQNLNHHNVKQLFTEYCDIKSEHGETVIDGPLLMMYSATDSTTLRLEMGYDSSEFVFNLYNLAGGLTVHIDSSGNAVFTGTVSAGDIVGSTITGGYIFGSTIQGGQITGSCIATTFDISVGNNIYCGAVAATSYENRGIYFYRGTSNEGRFTMDSFGNAYVRSPEALFLIGGAVVGIEACSGAGYFQCDNGEFYVIHTSDAPVKTIRSLSQGAVSNTLVLSSGKCYNGSSNQSTDVLGRRKWWKNFTPNVTYAGGPPSSFSTKICRYCVTDYDGWITLDIESTDGNNAVITAIGDPSSYNAGLYGNPFGCWTGWFNINSTRTPVRVYKFDTTNFVITGAPTLTDNIAWSFMMQGYFGA